MKPDNRREEEEELVEHWDWNTWSWKFPGTALEFDLRETIGLGIALVLFILGIYLALRKDKDDMEPMMASRSASKSGSRPPSAAEVSLSKQLSAAALSKGALVRKSTPKASRPSPYSQASKKTKPSKAKGKASPSSAKGNKGPKKIIVEM